MTSTTILSQIAPIIQNVLGIHYGANPIELQRQLTIASVPLRSQYVVTRWSALREDCWMPGGLGIGQAKAKARCEFNAAWDRAVTEAL